MSQRAGRGSVSFLTAVLYPDHWPAFQRRTVFQEDGCILFPEIPPLSVPVAECGGTGEKDHSHFIDE